MLRFEYYDKDTQSMNYKKIVKSQQLRFIILRLLFFIPDSLMLRWQYKIKMGRRLNLKNPERYTEKLQIYKMHYRNPILPVCVDKYEVRSYVMSCGLEYILNELYGIYYNPEDIALEKLPQQFIIKTTDGTGGENVFICKERNKLDIPQLLKLLNSWKNKKNINAGREWAYTGIANSRYIVEKYLENDPVEGLFDYKFFVFNGKVFCIQLDKDRYTAHKRNIYDKDWNLLNVTCTYPNVRDEVEKPFCWKEMVGIAEKLGEAFPFVRVDLYLVDSKVYFGELTFYPGSGYEGYIPDDFDYILGRQFDITSFLKKSNA